MSCLKLPVVTSLSGISKLVVAAILLSLCYLAFFQQEKAQAMGTIQFTVKESVYGNPIPNAQVLMSTGTSEYIIRTDAQGVATNYYNPITAGDYTITAVTYGYQAGSISQYLDSYSSVNRDIVLSAPDTSEEVVFPDPNLKRVVGETLYGVGVYNGEPITQYAMTFLREINYGNFEGGLRPNPESPYPMEPGNLIQNLEGLQYAVNLKKIVLSNQAVIDLSYLSNLTKLESIEMNSNQITSIPSLPNGITDLYLNKNQISDVSNLASMTNLQYVDLSNNLVSDITPFANAVSLKELNLSYNNITNIPVFQTVALERLYLSNNRITSIANLENANAKLTSLSGLDLSLNQITDAGPLKSLPGLFSINLSGNLITDISAWGSIDPNVANWYSLNLSGNQLSSLLGITKLSKLSQLFADANRLSALPSFTGMNKLNQVHLAHNQISDVSNLSTLSGSLSLNLLDLSHNKIADVTGFSVLSTIGALSTLDVSYNEISDFSALHGLKSLQNLNLSYNRIQSLSFMSTAPIGSYRTLKLSGNLITDLSPLSNQTALSSLYLDDMQIVDLSPLVTLAQNGGFTWYEKLISLYATPFDLISQQANLTALSQKSIMVRYSNPATHQAMLTTAATSAVAGTPITFSLLAKVAPDNYDSVYYTRHIQLEKDGLPVTPEQVLVNYAGTYAIYMNGKFLIGAPLDMYTSGLSSNGGLSEPIQVTFLQPGNYKVYLTLEGSRYDFSGEYTFIAAKSAAVSVTIGAALIKMDFIDTDPNPLRIGGSIKWKGLLDETKLNSYRIYYLDGNLQPFANSLIGEKPKGSVYEWAIPAGTVIPAEAKYMAIFTDTNLTKPIASMMIYDSTDSGQISSMIRHTYFSGTTKPLSVFELLDGIHRVGDLNGDGIVDRHDMQWMTQLVDPVFVKPTN